MIDRFDEAQEEILYPTVEDEWEVVGVTDLTPDVDLEAVIVRDPTGIDCIERWEGAYDDDGRYDDDPSPYDGTYSEE